MSMPHLIVKTRAEGGLINDRNVVRKLRSQEEVKLAQKESVSPP